jgi:hypothetical protein
MAIGVSCILVTMNTLKIGEISKELPIKNKMEEEDEGR